MKPYFYNISGTYTIVLPKIWSQNVTVSQILVLFILNLFSFYLQSILLAVFPNICLLILYLIFNNVIICKGSNDEKWTKFAECPTYPSDYMSKFHSNYPNLQLPFPGQCIPFSPIDFKDPNFLNLWSDSSSRNNFSCKNTNFTSIPINTTASNTITTSSTNYVQPQVVASTVTTFTKASCSPVPSVVSHSSPESFEPSLKSVAPCIYNVAKTTSTFQNTNFISEVSPMNVNSSNTNTVCSSLPVSHSQPFPGNFSNVFSETSHNVTPLSSVLSNSNDCTSKTFEISTQTDNQNAIQNNSFSLNKVCHNETILEKLSKLESVTLNSHEISNLSINEIKSMLELLPKFEGDLKYYKLFKEQFQVMTEHQNINSKDKAFLLYSCLSDNVRLNLGSVTLDNSINLKLLFENLDREYCSPQNSQLYYSNALFSIDTWSVCKNIEDLNKLYKFISENHKGLEREGCYESQLIYGMKILSLLEGDLSYNVAKILSESCSTQILPKILHILKHEIRMMEIDKIAQATTKGVQVKFDNNSSDLNLQKGDQTLVPEISENHQINDQHHISEFNDDHWIKKHCVFCTSKDHFSNECTYYSRSSDFKNSLFKAFRCYNCLKRGHRSFNCSKPKICKLCKDERPHNPILCNKNSNYNRV